MNLVAPGMSSHNLVAKMAAASPMLPPPLKKPVVTVEDHEVPFESLNKHYKFMSLEHLPFFKKQYLYFVNKIILRMYKSSYALLQLYPEANDFPTKSIFDKVY